MSNPNLRSYKLSGGPFDQKWATILPEMLEEDERERGDERLLRHHRVIFVRDDGEMEVSYKGRVWQKGRRNLYFRYILCTAVGLPESQVGYRYTYEGVWTEVADKDGEVIFTASVRDL